jgi:hypothetical protein
MTESERYAASIAYLIREETPNERVIRAHVDVLAVRPERVRVGNRDEMLVSGYLAGDCHRNCRRYADGIKYQHIMGWTIKDWVYFSHSVIRDNADNSLHCITPDHDTSLSNGDFFDFVEDNNFGISEIEGMYWNNNGNIINCHDVHNLTAIRRDVEFVINHYNEIQKKLFLCQIKYDEAIALGF